MKIFKRFNINFSIRVLKLLNPLLESKQFYVLHELFIGLWGAADYSWRFAVSENVPFMIT